jgi:16S rRNA (guanine(966)-N(2))-methyltransferase RsmD
MRVIAGAYRGRKLRTVEGAEVRPTSDRLRETLFNILAPTIRGTRFLDLCAGSGAVGIEALSRGATEVVFIESSRRACSVIEANLRTFGVDDGIRLICRDARAALTQLAETAAQFDIVFFDPPYASDLYDQVMKHLATGDLLPVDSIVVVEHRVKHRLAPAYSSLKMYRELKQGESALSFYTLKPEVASAKRTEGT